MRRTVKVLLLLFCASLATAADTPIPLALTDAGYRKYSQEQAELGRLLFYDRVLSGTYRVSCATCHNHDRASSNGYPLAGAELASTDDMAVNGLPVYEPFKPSARHAPTLFNLGAKDLRALFSDGRVAQMADGNFRSPAKQLPEGLSDVLAAQALFPAVTGDELVGRVHNDIAVARAEGEPAVWDIIAKRVQDLPDYLPLFVDAFGIRRADEITITHVANAIGAFVGTEWRSDDSAFDRLLRGDADALTMQQKRGMGVFYGKGNCAACHSGPFFSDRKYHAIAMPPWRFDMRAEDKRLPPLKGRISVTGAASDAYAMRTPGLRNVAHTGPWGHSGAFATLAAVVRHHLDPETSFDAWRAKAGADGALAQWSEELDAIAAANTLKGTKLEDSEIADLLAFLKALTDEAALKGRLGKPADVPSSLALD